MTSRFPSTSFFSNGSTSSSRGSSGTSSSSTSLRPSTSREPLGPIRNRENLVVSNREIRQLFDTMKELGDIVKQQSTRLENMSVKLETACKEVNDMKAQFKNVVDRQSQEAENESSHRGPVPKQLKRDVKLLHNQQESERQFRGSEGIHSAHNTAVRSFLYKELQKEHTSNSHGKSTIMRAVTRYYETKRQQYLDSLPTRRNSAEKRQCEKKLTSRRRRLFIKRLKVASERERVAMEQIDPSFMSDEEDGEEDTAGSWVVRSPPWRSPRLSALLKELQQRVDGATSSHPKNPRVPGEPSDRSPPSDSPAWALADRENREGSLESPPPASPSSASHHPASPQSSPRRSLFSDGEDDADDSSSDEQRVLAPSPVIRNKSRRVRPIRD